jgi:hypothetical protein
MFGLEAFNLNGFLVFIKRQLVFQMCRFWAITTQYCPYNGQVYRENANVTMSYENIKDRKMFGLKYLQMD